MNGIEKTLFDSLNEVISDDPSTNETEDYLNRWYADPIERAEAKERIMRADERGVNIPPGITVEVAVNSPSNIKLSDKEIQQLNINALEQAISQARAGKGITGKSKKDLPLASIAKFVRQ